MMSKFRMLMIALMISLFIFAGNVYAGSGQERWCITYDLLGLLHQECFYTQEQALERAEEVGIYDPAKLQYSTATSPSASSESCNACGGFENCCWEAQSGGWLYGCGGPDVD